MTDVALQEGEQLVGSGPVAAGDTVRWIVGDTESGAGPTKRIHILVKPTRPDLVSNLVINTDRRTYLLRWGVNDAIIIRIWRVGPEQLGPLAVRDLAIRFEVAQLRRGARHCCFLGAPQQDGPSSPTVACLRS